MLIHEHHQYIIHVPKYSPILTMLSSDFDQCSDSKNYYEKKRDQGNWVNWDNSIHQRKISFNKGPSSSVYPKIAI